MRFSLDNDVPSISYISDVTGECVAMSPDPDGFYSVSLKAGDGILLKAADNYSFALKDEANLFYLNKAIAAAESLDPAMYKPCGKEEFSEALAEAKRVAADGAVTQVQADNARAALVKAQGVLKRLAGDGVNLALHKVVSAVNSYEEGTFFSRAYLTDGINVSVYQCTHAGWSVDPFSGIGPEDPVELSVDLEEPYLLNKIVLKPCIFNSGASFPRDFKLCVSKDGETWTETASAEGVKLTEAIDLNYAFEPVEGRYVKLTITRHSGQTDKTGTSLSQIGELEVYGTELNGSESVVL